MKVLNVQSEFDMSVMDGTQQRQIKRDLEELPSEQEVLKAIGKLRSGTAAGSSGILPEMVKYACRDGHFCALLLDLIQSAWEQQRVPRDWADAIIIPIPKKGDLTCCDNWRGIALLEVVGKVLARVLQQRLQMVAEEVLPESQCGFRVGRGCSDMIFTVRQLLEKLYEHRAKIFLVFVDLKKAVPRAALWRALEKLGILSSVVSLIQSFHDGIKAQVRVSGALLEDIDVENGLRQGCSLAPTLFNLYAAVVAERWKEELEGKQGVGLLMEYKLDEKLFRRYTKNSERVRLDECQFADDAALLAATREGAEVAMGTYARVATSFGLTVSYSKTKLMVAGREISESDTGPLRIGAEEVECVEEFPYLGSIITASGRVDTEVERRITQASKAFGALRKPVFQDRNLSLHTKRVIYEACVLSVLLYGAALSAPNALEACVIRLSTSVSTLPEAVMMEPR